MLHINILEQYVDADDVFINNSIIPKATESILIERTNLVAVIKDFDSFLDASSSKKYTFDCQACLQHLFLGSYSTGNDFFLATESIYDSRAIFQRPEYHQAIDFPAHASSSDHMNSKIGNQGIDQVTVSACCFENCNGPRLYAIWENSTLLCALKTYGFEPAAICLFPYQIPDLWKESP